MGVVVGIGAADGLEGQMKFLPPCFAGCKLYVGKEDEGKLGVVDHDAVGMHASDFGTEEFNVGDDLFWKPNCKERMAASCSSTSLVLGWSAPWMAAVTSLWSS